MIAGNIRLQKIALQPVFARLKLCQDQAIFLEDKANPETLGPVPKQVP